MDVLAGLRRIPVRTDGHDETDEVELLLQLLQAEGGGLELRHYRHPVLLEERH
jgi:hypothetical protein